MNGYARFSYREREELLREELLLLLRLAELLFEELLRLDELLRFETLDELFLFDEPLETLDELLLLDEPLLLDELVRAVLVALLFLLLSLRDTLLLEVLLRALLDEGLLSLREPVTEVEPLRELLDEPLRDTLPFEVALREEALDVIAVRRFSSEFTFTTRFSLSREGTLTNPNLRSRLLFS